MTTLSVVYGAIAAVGYTLLAPRLLYLPRWGVYTEMPGAPGLRRYPGEPVRRRADLGLWRRADARAEMHFAQAGGKCGEENLHHLTA